MKDQLINIIQQSNGKIAVNAHDLYKFLGIKSHYRDWIGRMICEYGFMRDVDYMVSLKNKRNRFGGRPSKVVILTLDCAKEIAMVQRNKRGREARRYFISIQEHYAKRQLPNSPESRLNQLINGSIQDLDKRTAHNSYEITDLKHTVNNTMRVTSTEQYQLKNMNHHVVINQLGGYKSLGYQRYSSKAFSQCWHDFKDHFQLPRYADLPHGQFDNGLAFLSSWHLHGQLLTDVRLTNDRITLGVK